MTRGTQEASMIDIINQQLNEVIDFLPEILAAIFAFFIFLLIGWLIRRAIKIAITRKGDSVNADFLSGLPFWLFGFIGLLVGLDILGLDGVVRGLLAGGGATAIILGFAFREIGENLLAGLFLVFSKPFKIGDLIRSGDQPNGVVRGIDLRTTHIRTDDGRDIYIPNAKIFNETLTNFTKDGLRRPTFSVGIDYKAPMPEVRQALLSAVQDIKGVLKDPKPRVFISDFTDNYAVFDIQVWINTFSGTRFLDVKNNAMENCLQTILSNGWTLSSDVTTSIEIVNQPKVEEDASLSQEN